MPATLALIDGVHVDTSRSAARVVGPGADLVLDPRRLKIAKAAGMDYYTEGSVGEFILGRLPRSTPDS